MILGWHKEATAELSQWRFVYKRMKVFRQRYTLNKHSRCRLFCWCNVDCSVCGCALYILNNTIRLIRKIQYAVFRNKPCDGMMPNKNSIYTFYLEKEIYSYKIHIVCLHFPECPTKKLNIFPPNFMFAWKINFFMD